MKMACALGTAVVIECVGLWVLVVIVGLGAPIALVLAFTAAYLTFFSTARRLRAFSKPAPLRALLGKNLPIGLAALLLMEVVLYLCTDLLGLMPSIANLAGLTTVLIWIVLGWELVRDRGLGP